MVSNDIEQMNISRLTVEEIMNFEEKDLDLLLEKIKYKLEENRQYFEQILEEF